MLKKCKTILDSVRKRVDSHNSASKRKREASTSAVKAEVNAYQAAVNASSAVGGPTVAVKREAGGDGGAPAAKAARPGGQ